MDSFLTVTDACNHAGTCARSDDSVGSTDRIAWAIDGATSFGVPESHQQYDVQWLVESLASELHAMDGSISSVEILRRLAGKVDHELRRCRFPAEAVPPSSAIGLIRLSDHQLEWAILGDVVIVVGRRGGSCIVSSDWTLAQREQQMIAASVTMSASDLSVFGTKRRMRDMNRTGGYWVLSRSREAAAHAVYGTVPIADVTSVLLMTDGFSRCVDVFGLYERWEDLLGDVRSGTRLGTIVSNIRQLESDDSARTQFARLKTSDDAAAIHLQITSQGGNVRWRCSLPVA